MCVLGNDMKETKETVKQYQTEPHVYSLSLSLSLSHHQHGQPLDHQFAKPVLELPFLVQDSLVQQVCPVLPVPYPYGQHHHSLLSHRHS